MIATVVALGELFSKKRLPGLAGSFLAHSKTIKTIGISYFSCKWVWLHTWLESAVQSDFTVPQLPSCRFSVKILAPSFPCF